MLHLHNAPKHSLFPWNQTLTWTKTAQRDLLAVCRNLMPPRGFKPIFLPKRIGYKLRVLGSCQWQFRAFLNGFCLQIRFKRTLSVLLSGQIFRKGPTLQPEIASVSKTVAFGISNLLLDIRPKCLTCKQYAKQENLKKRM